MPDDVFFFGFGYQYCVIQRRTKSVCCCLVGMMLHLSLCSCRQMILSRWGLEKMQACLQTLPSSQLHYLIGFLHDHGWLHFGNSWGELLADDHVEATPPVLSMWIGWRKVNTCAFGSTNWFWASIFTKFATRC